MNLARVSGAYLWARRRNTALNVMLLALGVAAVTLLFLTTVQLEERLYRDARGFDLVVGARGSQTQIVLSSVYELDQPTGSIAWSEAEAISRHPAVKKAIPIALGDSHRGFRVVGTTHDYVAHYGAKVSQGRLWERPLEAVLGADVYWRLRPRVGSTFAAMHGLAGDRGAVHDEHYRVVGVLARTGSVIDRLVLTDVASYWLVHAVPEQPEEGALVVEPPRDEGKSLSALLVQSAAPAHAPDLVAFVNSYSDLQAASPASESARFARVIAVSVELLRAFAVILMLTAALSIFIALYNALEERRYDLAIMRALGATRAKIATLLLVEGLALAAVGAALGLALGHLSASLLGAALRQAQQISISGYTWYPAELWIVALALAVGLLAAVPAAWRASDTDIAGTLARG